MNSMIYDHEWLAKGSQEKEALSSQPRYIFSPSLLVTKRIFLLLSREQINDCFLYGRLGIGKSSSIALYLQLNQFISQYFCEADKDPTKR